MARKKRKSKKQGQSIWPFIVGLIILIGAIVGIIILLRPTTTTEPTDTVPLDDTIIASVNGEAITMTELNARSHLTPGQLQLTQEQVLEILIAEKLLMQDAARRGIVSTDEEVDESVELLLGQSGLDSSQLEENLAVYGLDKDSFLSMVRQQLTIIKLLNATLDQRVSIGPTEVMAYFEENKEQFYTEGTATVRHILIGLTDRSAEEASALAQGVLAELQAGADFCDLVTEHSEDPGSMENCGEYVFPRGVMVAPFEEAAFAMENGALRVVDTDFGSHVMLKLDQAEGKQLAFEDVQEPIQQQLVRDQQLEVYETYIAELRASADITFPGTPAIDVDMVAEDSVMEKVEPVMEPAMEVKKEPVMEEPEEVMVEEPVSDTFAACISESATLYTASWDSASQQEIAKFDNPDALTVVDCTADAAACTAAGVEAYPTWIIDGKTFLGSLSEGTLKALTGC